jgi:hypothetical protein
MTADRLVLEVLTPGHSFHPGERFVSWFRGTRDRHEGRIRAGGVDLLAPVLAAFSIAASSSRVHAVIERCTPRR